MTFVMFLGMENSESNNVKQIKRAVEATGRVAAIISLEIMLIVQKHGIDLTGRALEPWTHIRDPLVDILTPTTCLWKN